MVQTVAQNVVRDAGDARVAGRGYVWGCAVEPSESHAKFDLILLSDLVMNHSDHRALLWTCEQAVARGGCMLEFFTHHKPHHIGRDLAFFEVARETGVGVREGADGALRVYVPGGFGRGGDAVYGARVEVHKGRRRLAVFVFCRRREKPAWWPWQIAQDNKLET